MRLLPFSTDSLARPALTAAVCLFVLSPGFAAADDAEPPEPREPEPEPEPERERDSISPEMQTAGALSTTGRNCLGDPAPKLVMQSLIGIKYGDWGIEHQLRVGACVPLVRKPGVLFDFSFIEAGFVMHTSPIYVMPGAYFRIAPLSILQFTVEAAPIFYWPIGIASAGYFPIDSYESDYTKASLPAEDGQTAVGWYARFGPGVRVAFPVGPLRVIVLDDLRIEHYRIGEADHYFHNRNDLPAATNEWFLDNMALLLLEIPLHRNALLRVGLNDQVTMNFGGGNLGNALRGVAMVSLLKLGPQVRDFTPMLAIGGRTAHPMRKGDFNFILALDFKVDMLAKKTGPDR